MYLFLNVPIWPTKLPVCLFLCRYIGDSEYLPISFFGGIVLSHCMWSIMYSVPNNHMRNRVLLVPLRASYDSDLRNGQNLACRPSCVPGFSNWNKWRRLALAFLCYGCWEEVVLGLLVLTYWATWRRPSCRRRERKPHTEQGWGRRGSKKHQQWEYESVCIQSSWFSLLWESVHSLVWINLVWISGLISGWILGLTWFEFLP